MLFIVCPEAVTEEQQQYSSRPQESLLIFLTSTSTKESSGTYATFQQFSFPKGISKPLHEHKVYMNICTLSE